MEVLTQTQERKLWQSIISGNEHAIKWNEIITAFAGLGMDRQITALKRVPLDKFLAIREIHDVVLKKRKKEIAALEERKHGILEIKSLMDHQGISISDLSLLTPMVEPKKKYSARFSRMSPEEFLKSFISLAVDGIVTEKTSDIAELLNVGVSTAYARLSQLTKSGHLLNLGRNGYQVLDKGDGNWLDH